jgi:transposase-like protein
MPTGSKQVRFSDEIAQEFLDAYSQGVSVREICSWEGMPDRVTLYRWRREYEHFATAYARARESNAETIEDNMLDIERQVMEGMLEPQAANVVLASQRWRARVLHPAQYGEKVDLKHSGNVGLSINIDLGDKK